MKKIIFAAVAVLLLIGSVVMASTTDQKAADCGSCPSCTSGTCCEKAQ